MTPQLLGGPFLIQIYNTRISGPDGPLILAVDLRNTPKWGGGGGYGRTDGPTHCFIYIDAFFVCDLLDDKQWKWFSRKGHTHTSHLRGHELYAFLDFLGL